MKYLNFITLTCIFLSCNSPTNEKTEPENINIATDSLLDDTIAYKQEKNLLVWKVDYDYTKIKNASLSNNNVVADSLIKGLNQKYENVFLEKINQSHDTLYTIIRESEFLTQQMGSTGAEVYLADVVLNLTEVPGIRYVKIDLREGDHMQPGTWTKEDFKKYKTIK